MITPDTAPGWAEFPIPGGAAPVPIVQLRFDPASRAQTLFVRFPAGWSRPVSGFYEAAEEFVVISGTLRMSGATYEPGDWGYVPAGSVRTATDVLGECLVFARFDGPARWREAAEAAGPAPMTAPLSGEPRELRRGDGSIVRYGPVEAGVPAAGDTEVLDLARAAYAFVAAGSPLPPVDGACFVRVFGGDA
ncbi:MAG TPA: hypothetical protein VGB64_02880 [Actinomycetota bacterium]